MWNNQGGFQNYEQGGVPQGGGYMSPGGFGTPQASQDRKTRQRVQNLLPVTIAELINATQNEDKFFTGDIEISQVTLIGLVKSVKESATRIDYEIDDMSGPPLEVKQFVDNDESVPDMERVQPMRENTYVRVCGHVRAFGGKRSVVAFKMVPIMDMNELTCHLLEVVHSHMALSQGSGMNTTGGGTKMAAGGDVSYSGGGMGGGGGETISGLSPIQNQVHLLVRGNVTDQGASIDSICQQLRGVPEKAIRDAIEFLSSEGHIYSTIDEDHYKATDS